MVKATVIHSPLGIFAFDEEDRLIEETFFPKDSKAVADTLKALEKGEIVGEIGKLKTKLEE